MPHGGRQRQAHQPHVAREAEIDEQCAVLLGDEHVARLCEQVLLEQHASSLGARWRGARLQISVDDTKPVKSHQRTGDAGEHEQRVGRASHAV